MFLSEAFANSADTLPSQASNFNGLFLLLILFAVFYFLVIRPQSKQYKAKMEMISNLKMGNQVVTSGGLIGKITQITENDSIISIEIAKGVEVQTKKESVIEVVEKAKPAQEKKSSAKKTTTKTKAKTTAKKPAKRTKK